MEHNIEISEMLDTDWPMVKSIYLEGIEREMLLFKLRHLLLKNGQHHIILSVDWLL